MKKFLMIAGIVAVSSSAIAAQKQKMPSSDGQEPTSRQGKVKNSGETKNSDKAILSGSSSLQAELQQTLDVKRTRVGDTVLLKTTKALKQNGETVVPKGTALVGRVTEVERGASSKAGSRIGMVIDRLQGKGLNEPITATIVSIVDTRAALSAADSGADLSGSAMGSGSASAGGTRNSGGSGGGGLLGGVGSAVGGVGSTVGGVVNTTANTAGSVAGAATQTVGGVTGSTVNAVGGSLNGLRISQSTSASANGSTAISSPARDLRIEKGVTFNLLVNNSVEN